MDVRAAETRGHRRRFCSSQPELMIKLSEQRDMAVVMWNSSPNLQTGTVKSKAGVGAGGDALLIEMKQTLRGFC